MKKFFLPLLLAPFIANGQGKAKSATVIFTNGTTREFLVEERDAMLNPHRFLLKDGNTGKTITLTPLEARTVSIAGGDTWTGAILDVDQTPVDLADEKLVGNALYKPRKDTVFLLTEMHGSVVSLFSLQDRQRTHLFLTKQGGPFQELIYHHYIQDDNGRQLEREDKRYQAQVADAVKECPLIVSATEDLRFSGTSIAQLLKSYEKDCLKSTSVETRSDRKKGKLAIAPMIGYTLNQPSFNSTSANDLIPPGPVKIAGTPSFGIAFILNMPVMKYRLAVGADIYYNAFKAHSDTVHLKGGSPSFYTAKGLDYQVSTIRTNVYLKYYFTQPSKIRPFIKAGLGFGISPSHSATPHEYEFYSDALHEVTRKDPFQEQGFKTAQFGFTAGAGLEIYGFAIQYKFESYTGYITTLSTGSSLAVHSVFLSYRIK